MVRRKYLRIIIYSILSLSHSISYLNMYININIICKTYIQKNKAAAEVGIIQSVVVQNFMCHRYLEITLGPHVNFITGENGSTL